MTLSLRKFARLAAGCMHSPTQLLSAASEPKRPECIAPAEAAHEKR